MAIKFEFTLNDIDAENLIGCILHEKDYMHNRILEINGNPNGECWYQKRIKYLDKIKERVLSHQTRLVDREQFEIPEGEL